MLFIKQADLVKKMREGDPNLVWLTKFQSVLHQIRMWYEKETKKIQKQSWQMSSRKMKPPGCITIAYPRNQ